MWRGFFDDVVRRSENSIDKLRELRELLSIACPEEQP
jgi:hypothetical protein